MTVHVKFEYPDYWVIVPTNVGNLERPENIRALAVSKATTTLADRGVDVSDAPTVLVDDEIVVGGTPFPLGVHLADAFGEVARAIFNHPAGKKK